MPDAIEQAKASFGRWNNAFNARDMEGMVAEMHFPHRRMAGDNEFQVWRTEADFRATRGDNATASLAAQKWHHTATTSIEVVQSSADKVHLAINQSRRRAGWHRIQRISDAMDLHQDRWALGRSIPLFIPLGSKLAKRKRFGIKLPSSR